MDDLTSKEYEKIWADGATSRGEMNRLREYYDGVHSIVGSSAVYSDGSDKSEVVSNFIRFAVDLYVGAMSDSYNVTSLELETDDDDEIVNDGPGMYRRIGTANNFDTADVMVRRDAYIYGWGIETHEFIDGEIKITPRDPVMWHRVYNSDGVLIGLINMSEIPAGGFSGSEMIDESLHVMVVITDKSFKTFHKSKDINSGNWFTPEGFPDSKHNYGAVPAVIYQVNESMATHIRADIIGLQDEYNEIDSASGDNVKSDSDGLLALKGFSQADVQENAETIKSWRLLPLPQDGSADYISKPTDTERIVSRLDRVRKNIFMSLGVPDMEEIVGSTGSTSGIALQLKFKPMTDNSKAMIAWLRSGVRDRIDLINAVTSKSSGSSIQDVQVNIAFSLPRNTVEEWQNIGALSGIVSHRKQLEMLTDVSDPDQEERRLAAEGATARLDFSQTGTPDEIIAKQDIAVTAGAEAIQPQISTVIDSIADAVLAETLRRSSQ
jgi:SPP1 family phage portal protein